MAAVNEINRDLTLPPDTYLYLQNIGKGGIITTYKGPFVVNQTGQDQPVRYDPPSRKYHECSLDQAIQYCPRVAEGDYVIIENPAEDGGFPKDSNTALKPLKKGCKVVIPGPWCEALYPGQSATVIEGHRLRSNQYLVAMVYNAEAAENNWEKGTVVKEQTDHTQTGTGTSGEGGQSQNQTNPEAKKARGLPKPESFAVGTRIIVQGSDVSFFIPCTGVSVLQDTDNGQYVRDAVTLEQLEYCCLIDENGKKEYPRGPAVVFPRPTQVFEKDGKQRRKFKPIELNKINGLHLKVTANFTDLDFESESPNPKERAYREGEELFVTGKSLAIFYPREELAVVEYGQGNKKHYSTTIPKGEGRYVIDRTSGDIKLVRGPRMYLADPRSEIPVRRVLSQEECKLWYPSSELAAAYNAELERAMAESPSGRSGIISEGDVRKRQLRMSRGATPAADYLVASAAIENYGEYAPEEVGDEGATATVTRGTKFTQPRAITLNTKFDGVPKVVIWPGFAVLIVGSEGSRRVEVGPQPILLEYDEKLGHMELSTGKPKNSDNLLRTVYLKVQNNQVGDIVAFESSDHVKGRIKISLRVNFEADSEEDRLKWFGVDNYVKYLTDHVRSMVAGMAKKNTIAGIKADYVNLVREAILGQKDAETGKRTGLLFEDNGMRVIEVEVLDLELLDVNIAKMLDAAQIQVVQANIQIDQARKDLEATREKENIAQQKAEVTQTTQLKQIRLQRDAVIEQLGLAMTQLDSELKKSVSSTKNIEAQEALKTLGHTAELARQKAKLDQDLAYHEASQGLQVSLIEAETTAAEKRFLAAKDGLHETLVALSRDDMVLKLAEALNIERYITGDSLGSSVANILSFMPAMQGLWDKANQGQKASNGKNRLAQAATQ